MLCVYAVFKEGLKVYKRRLAGRYPLDGVIDVSWQRGVVEPRVVALGRPLRGCRRVLLVEKSVVSGTTVELVARSHPGVNFIVAAEHVDFYGAFYTDYIVADEGLARIERVEDWSVKLETGDTVPYAFKRGEFIEGPSVLKTAAEGLLRASISSWLEGRPLAPRGNTVYELLEHTDRVVARVEAVRSLFPDAVVATPRWRMLVYEGFREKFSPTLERAVYRALLYLRERGFTAPLAFGVVDRVGRIATIGHSLAYPALRKAMHPIYVVHRDTLHPGEPVDVDALDWLEVSI